MSLSLAEVVAVNALAVAVVSELVLELAMRLPTMVKTVGAVVTALLVVMEALVA